MYELSILIQGFPGRSTCHGGLGWSTVALLRGHGETVLIDTGGWRTVGRNGASDPGGVSCTTR